MFSNMGRKIKVLAQVLFGISVVGAVIAGIVVTALGLIAIGFAIMGGGFLFSWIGSFFLYGYGELIDQTMITASLAQQQLTALQALTGGSSLQADGRAGNGKAQPAALYSAAQGSMRTANTEKALLTVAAQFDALEDYQDARTLARQCREKAEACRKDNIYATACTHMAQGTVPGLESAIRVLETIPGWRDAEDRIYACQKQIAQIREKEEAKRLEAQRKAEERRLAAARTARRLRRAAVIGTPILCACIAFFIVLGTVIIPASKYNRAMGLIDNGEYDAAYALLEEIGRADAITVNKYNRAMGLIDNGEYDAAYALLEEIGRADAITVNKYNRAMGHVEAGEYDAAYALLAGLHYQDSEEKLQEVVAKQMLSAQVGDTVLFGAYRQGNRISNGKKAIEWLVLAKENGRILLVSKYALDCQPYHTSNTSVTWETSSLRAWLNGTFLNEAFSMAEQRRIVTSTVMADRNPKYDTDPGQATEDKVFLLSVAEAERYFTTDEARRCAPTAYVIAQGVYVSDSYTTADGAATCFWWLRSLGTNQYFAANVGSDGALRYRGYGVNRSTGGVRPALWVNVGS